MKSLDSEIFYPHFPSFFQLLCLSISEVDFGFVYFVLLLWCSGSGATCLGSDLGFSLPNPNPSEYWITSIHRTSKCWEGVRLQKYKKYNAEIKKYAEVWAFPWPFQLCLLNYSHNMHYCSTMKYTTQLLAVLKHSSLISSHEVNLFIKLELRLAYIKCKLHYEVISTAADTWICQKIWQHYTLSADYKTQIKETQRKIIEGGQSEVKIIWNRRLLILLQVELPLQTAHTQNAPSLHVHLPLSDLAPLSMQQYKVGGEHSPQG